MTRTKFRTFAASALLILSLILTLSALSGCTDDQKEEPYTITYGTYKYYGIRITDTSAGTHTDESAEETGEALTVPVDATFNEDGTAKLIFNNTEYNFGYKVDNDGFVTFTGEDAGKFYIRDYDADNHGYFEDGKFYMRWSYNKDTHIERLSICVLQ